MANERRVSSCRLAWERLLYVGSSTHPHSATWCKDTDLAMPWASVKDLMQTPLRPKRGCWVTCTALAPRTQEVTTRVTSSFPRLQGHLSVLLINITFLFICSGNRGVKLAPSSFHKVPGITPSSGSFLPKLPSFCGTG